MSTDNKVNPNDDAVNAGEAAKKATNTLRANLSMNGEEEHVGAGLMAVHMDRGLMKQLKKDKKQARKDKAFNAALASMEALRIHRGELEADLGGLDVMGSKVGLERKKDETDDEFRSRLKEEIFAQIAAGTLNDPTGKYKEWADTQEGYEQQAAMHADKTSKLTVKTVATAKSNTLIDADNNQDAKVKQAAVTKYEEIKNDGVSSVTDTTLDSSAKRDVRSDLFNKSFAANAEALEMTKGFNISTGLMPADDLMASAPLMDDTSLNDKVDPTKYTV